MDSLGKLKKYYGIILFLVVVIGLAVYGTLQVLDRKASAEASVKALEQKEATLQTKKAELARVQKRIQEIRDSITGAQKKIYAPIDSGLDDDTLFFALYNDTLEMVRSNSIKIKSIDYGHNPSSDPFVSNGKGSYFVCDINLELVSNYVNLGKLIQDIYQYPYYIKINELSVKPYNKDKKILLTKLNLRLYARTEPEEDIMEVSETEQALKNIQ